MVATRKGEVKKTPLKEFQAVRSNGLIAMDIEEGDALIAAKAAKATAIAKTSKPALQLAKRTAP